MVDWKVPLADLDYGIEEEEAVLAVLRSKWLTMGGVTQQFEAEFSQLIQEKHAIAVGNCTQALHLACLALNVGPGDEVILPSLSFVATANAVRYCGATIRFADIIGPEELTIDPNEIERLITPRTKAVIVMHYAGYPCRMNEIMAITAKHGIPVIEDTAHAPGAWLDGKSLGSWGRLGCFSFFSNKNLSTGEGGMITTDDDALAEKIRLMRSHGMTTLTYDRHQGHAFSYDVVALGYNFRIDEIHSALGLTQLHKLAQNNQRRGEIVRMYWTGLQDTDLTLPFQSWEAEERVKPAYHVMPVLLPAGTDRYAFMTKLRDAGIQSSIHYPPTHTFSDFRKNGSQISLPKTEEVSLREVTLPLYPGMSDEQVKLVVHTVKSLLERY
jgi:dTDP-4-amino-4,6-dideoxygalactose transaminase